MFQCRIAYNIRLGRPDSTEAETVEAAKVAYIHDFIISLPDGYETRVGERGLQLSGGEKQRIAIARAVIKDPIFFVFDDTTSSLDVNIERAILNNIIDAYNKATAIVMAHRLSTVIHAEEIIVLEQVHVVECGTHIELLRKSSTYAALRHSQCGHLESRESSIQSGAVGRARDDS